MNRRDFLRAGAAVVAVASVPTVVALAEPEQGAAELINDLNDWINGLNDRFNNHTHVSGGEPSPPVVDRLPLRGATKRIVYRWTSPFVDQEHLMHELWRTSNLPPHLYCSEYVRITMKELRKGDHFRMYEGISNDTGLLEPCHKEDRLYTASCDAFRVGRDGGDLKVRDMHPDEPECWAVTVDVA